MVNCYPLLLFVCAVIAPAAAAVAAAVAAATTPAAPTNLRVEGLTAAEAVISEPLPRFSFVHAAGSSPVEPQPQRGTRQQSYRITVHEEALATSAAAPPAPLLWDSGDVPSANCSEIEYNGTALQPFTRYEWTAS